MHVNDLFSVHVCANLRRIQSVSVLMSKSGSLWLWFGSRFSYTKKYANLLNIKTGFH